MSRWLWMMKQESIINGWQGLSITNTDASLWKVENKGKMLVLGCRQDTIDTIIILVRDYFWASNENEAYIRIDWLEQKSPFVMTHVGDWLVGLIYGIGTWGRVRGYFSNIFIKKVIYFCTGTGQCWGTHFTAPVELAVWFWVQATV